MTMKQFDRLAELTLWHRDRVTTPAEEQELATLHEAADVEELDSVEELVNDGF